MVNRTQNLRIPQPKRASGVPRPAGDAGGPGGPRTHLRVAREGADIPAGQPSTYGVRAPAPEGGKLRDLGGCWSVDQDVRVDIGRVRNGHRWLDAHGRHACTFGVVAPRLHGTESAGCIPAHRYPRERNRPEPVASPRSLHPESRSWSTAPGAGDAHPTLWTGMRAYPWRCGLQRSLQRRRRDRYE